MEKVLIPLIDETATVTFGAKLAASCQESCVINIYGDIGTGKTTFCRGVIQALGFPGKVKSPTYTLVESYLLARWNVYHFDLYRLSNTEELEYMGIQDYFYNRYLFLIEWPQSCEGLLPTMDLSITLKYKYPGIMRLAEAQAFSAIGKKLLFALSI
ncbi:tRNA (adenosine(37)-N6)-threonylcarbamoyltransferase complex ATPase subunit type 1 TsaE [Candidatus Palibaumannia cicadellinicola]|uniref:tRNA threonylcarbamoyladenosine biosynthesis protein TsaE n=1 Tax=Candidatus Palibaumannia cicadellinicola TaxID=186490 RepID=A0A0K2BL50_9GAMM|nr:tRNA (adenosine(37)-N6)-threonylcarbamoyltransferase complex ATPase subunit type 1 TsaE [Candidatus Baumannia cicadellinicola]AKZ66111.1 ATPase YjeE, predicted to have essential role in cell wall biosynthesis [Candidatus Baumannia cicadellinicola]